MNDGQYTGQLETLSKTQVYSKVVYISYGYAGGYLASSKLDIPIEAYIEVKHVTTAT